MILALTSVRCRIALIICALLTTGAKCQQTSANSSSSSSSTTSSSTSTSWNFDNSFPGSGHYTAVVNLPLASQICTGTTITGLDGTALCESSTATSDAALPPEVLTGTSVWDSAAHQVDGTMVNNGAWDVTTAFVPGYFTGVSNTPSAAIICTGNKFLGTNGTAICQSGTTASAATAAGVLSGKDAWNAAGTKMTGTMSNRGTWNITTAFPGTGKISGISSAPGATGVCSGTTVTGTAGTAICEAGTTMAGAAAADIVASKEAWSATGAKLTGTMLNAANWNITTTFPGTGKYTGVTNMPASTTYCTTSTLVNVAGTAICEVGTTSSAATAANIKTTLEAWNASGTKLTGTMADNGSLDASVAWTGQGYYSGITNSKIPLAAQICSGTTVLGVAGTATCATSHLISNTNRNKGTTQLNQGTEVTTYAGTTGPTGYHDVPEVSKDDDGYSGVNTLYAPRPSTNCGTSGTVAARITNCSVAWDGNSKGNNGQAVWRLVSRVGANKEVWQDQRTGLLWSSLVLTSDTWCHAAGNTPGNDGADPQNVCNANAMSACAEATGMTSAVGGENWATQTYDAAKGQVGKLTTTAVRWRLPTKYDYDQAEVDGIRMVMPDMGWAGASRPTPDMSTGSAAVQEWAATTNDPDTTNAWYYQSDVGITGTADRTNTYAARCVGR